MISSTVEINDNTMFSTEVTVYPHTCMVKVTLPFHVIIALWLSIQILVIACYSLKPGTCMDKVCFYNKRCLHKTCPIYL